MALSNNGPACQNVEIVLLNKLKPMQYVLCLWDRNFNHSFSALSHPFPLFFRCGHHLQVDFDFSLLLPVHPHPQVALAAIILGIVYVLIVFEVSR